VAQSGNSQFFFNLDIVFIRDFSSSETSQLKRNSEIDYLLFSILARTILIFLNFFRVCLLRSRKDLFFRSLAIRVEREEEKKKKASKLRGAQ
jgi:hypothetical protein